MCIGYMNNIHTFILLGILLLGVTTHSEPAGNNDAVEFDLQFLEKSQIIIFGKNKNKNGKSENNVILVIKDTADGAEKINLSEYKMRKNRYFLYIKYKDMFSGETRVIYADEDGNFTVGKEIFNVSRLLKLGSVDK